jgi:hypothetical protein
MGNCVHISNSPIIKSNVQVLSTPKIPSKREQGEIREMREIKLNFVKNQKRNSEITNKSSKVNTSNNSYVKEFKKSKLIRKTKEKTFEFVDKISDDTISTRLAKSVQLLHKLNNVRRKD